MRAALQGTELESLPVSRLHGDLVLVTGVSRDRIVETWRAARATVDQTGRWPVAVGLDSDADGDLVYPPEGLDIDEFRASVAAVDPWRTWQWWMLREPVELESDLHFHVSDPRFPGLDDRALALLPSDGGTVTRWVFDEVLADPELSRLTHERASYHSWGTMLQFLVTNPPELGNDAWTLACQLKALAGNMYLDPCTVAFAVSRSDAWFLHSRP